MQGSVMTKSTAEWQRIGERFLSAVADRDFARFPMYFHPQVFSRLLVPAGLMTPSGVNGLADKYKQWFGDADHFEIVRSAVTLVGDRLHIDYTLSVHEAGAWYSVEQQTYSFIAEGKIVNFDLLCSGFRPVPDPADIEPAAGDSSQRDGKVMPASDAVLEMTLLPEMPGTLCAVLAPAMKARLKEIDAGQVLKVRVDDPSARLDVPAWCNLTGNPLVSTVEEGDGTLNFFIEKKARGV